MSGAFLVDMGKKINTKDIFSLIIPVILGVFSVVVWKYCINLNNPYNLWISNDVYPVYLIITFTTASFLNAFIVLGRINIYIYLLCFSIIYPSSWFGYYLCKKLFILLYDKAAYDNHVLYVWILIVIVGLISLIHYLTINFFIKKMRPFHVFTFVAVFISVIPASLITVDWFPDHGGLKTFINSIKLGYPMLWINILLGWTTYALTKKII